MSGVNMFVKRYVIVVMCDFPPFPHRKYKNMVCYRFNNFQQLILYLSIVEYKNNCYFVICFFIYFCLAIKQKHISL